MHEPTLWTLILLQSLTLGLAGIAGAWAAGRLGTAPMVGAVLAGILLGPTFTGQLFPATYHYLFVGGHELVTEIREFEEQAAEDRRRLEATGVTEIAIEQHDAVVEEELERLHAQLDEARGPHEQTLLVVALAGLAFVMLSATRGVANLGPWRTRLPAAVTIAAGSAALAAVTAAVLVALLAWLGWLQAPWPWMAGIAIGCAAAATPIPAVFLQRPRGHEMDRPLLQITAWCVTFGLLVCVALLAATAAPDDAAAAAGYLTTAGSILLLVIIALISGPLVDAASDRFIAPTSDGSRTPAALAAFTLALIVLLGIALVGFTLATVALAVFASASALRRSHHAYAIIGGLGDRAAQGFFSPMLMALAGVHVHLLADFDILLLIAVMLAFGDGKALGALLAGRGSNFSWRAALKSGAALASGSATPVALALLLLLSGIIDGHAYTALVLAAMICTAIASPLMRSIDYAFPDTEPPSR